MSYMISLTITFIIMLSAPFIGAAIYCNKKKGDILFIRQEKVKDARYFGKSFAKTFEENLADRKQGVISLSKSEEYLCDDLQKEYPENVDKLLMSLYQDITVHSNVKVFNKEIYCAHNIYNLNDGLKLRAAYSKKKIVLGNNTEVERWVDAEETVAIYDGCQIGASASAGKRLSIGKDCKFRRLYAPEILIGQYPQNYKDSMENKNPLMYEAAPSLSVIRNLKHVDEEQANEDKEVDATILTKHDLVVLEGIIIKGDVRSHKGIRLCEESIVCGNVFAEEDIYISRNVVILGNVFTQGSVYVESGAVVGQPGKISSIIARDNITFEKDIAVYGYVSCEHGGMVISSNIDGEVTDYQLLDAQETITELRFDNLEAYEKIDEQGYRKEEKLQKVDILVDAKTIPKSLFFSCKALEKVTLPDTLEEIGPYAFADCEALSDITSFAKMPLRTIGTSAFENCVKLEKVELPETIESIGGAAFAGCTGLKTVSMAKCSNLKIISSHCFRGCTSLEYIDIPDSIENVEISAFIDCDSLKTLMVPESLMDEPGILQLRIECKTKVLVKGLEM